MVESGRYGVGIKSWGFPNRVLNFLLRYIAITLVARMRVKKDDDLSRDSPRSCLLHTSISYYPP